MPPSQAPLAAPPPGQSKLAFQAPELPIELREFLTLPGRHVLLIRGPAGTGKSTLSVELLKRLQGHLILVSPAGEGIDDRLAEFVRRNPATQILHVTMTGNRQSKTPSGGLAPGHVLAAGPFGEQRDGDRPPWVETILGQLSSTGHTYIVVDHWTSRATGAAGGAPSGEAPSRTDEREIQALRSALEGTATHLIIVAESAPSAPVVSGVDGLIETGFEPTPNGRIRLLTLRKLRGVPIATPEYPYSLAEGRFRCAMPLPPNFQPPIGPPDPSPFERDGFLWPGSTAFAKVFGWLRLGAITSIELGQAIPDYFAPAITTPLLAHTLLVGGRAVVVPMPTRLPEEVVSTLLQWVPSTTLKRNLRILSAGGSEADPLLKKILFALRPNESKRASTTAAARVTPAFDDVVRFLRETEPGKPALYLLCFDGLRAVAAVTGIEYDPATFPIIVARYAQLPGFHGVAVARVGDPLAVTIQDHAETFLHADSRHGRLFLSGVRPETVLHGLSWGEGAAHYRLIPMS
jgi:hypothetical protein